jgi:hypothetical protein
LVLARIAVSVAGILFLVVIGLLVWIGLHEGYLATPTNNSTVSAPAPDPILAEYFTCRDLVNAKWSATLYDKQMSYDESGKLELEKILHYLSAFELQYYPNITPEIAEARAADLFDYCMGNQDDSLSAALAEVMKHPSHYMP